MDKSENISINSYSCSNENSKTIENKSITQKLSKENSNISLSNINQSSDKYCYFNCKSNII